MRQRLFVLIVLLCCGSASLVAQEITTIILVRHAEKGFDEGGDPGLTEEGRQRAEELVRVLSGTQVDAIFTTPFKRTRQTVQPLATSRSLEIGEYNPFKLEDVVQLIQEHEGKTLVFSGHSNTTPVLLNKLVGEDRYRQLDEADYDNLYIVSYLADGPVKVVSLEYGHNSDL